jgi:hypothetical protein
MITRDLMCPFTDTPCEECGLYRGRHYYIRNCQKNKDCILEPRDGGVPHQEELKAYFQALENELVISRPEGGHRTQTGLPIRLKVVDVENGVTRVCPLEEAKTWDWGNEQVMRLIDGRHITNWDQLVEVLSYKADKGYQEVKIYEAPRFMVLAGG